MKITLRKANAVQLAVNEAVKALAFDTSVQLNEFEDATAQIDAVHRTFQANRETRAKLMDALYEIRKAVAHANASAGIDDMLAEVAHMEKDIQFFNGFATKTARLSDAVIAGKMEKIKGLKEESRLYGRYDTLDTGIFTKEEIEDFKRSVAELKRQKQKLQDTLLELNVRTEIELSAETAQALTAANVL
jgi:uncharacterized protein YdcH (DUF465 family)